MELAYRLEEIQKKGVLLSRKELNELSIEFFGEKLRDGCNTCLYPTFRNLQKLLKEKMPKTNCKYRFTKNWKNKTVVVTIGGTSHKITAETLSNATAEAILNSGAYRKDIIELNPDYTGTDVVKKNLMEGQPGPQPLLSISKEVKNDGKQSKKTANAKK